jgi:hypothetical protein
MPDRPYSPVAGLIRIGQKVIDHVVAGAPCPLCGCRQGEHLPDCLAGEAVVKDPRVAEMLKTKRKEEGNG